MKHFVNDAVIEFSDQVPVYDPNGDWFNPFTLYSYVARVKFEDNHVVIVSLFPGAATRRQGEYVKAVAQAAAHAKEHGEHVAQVTAS